MLNNSIIRRINACLIILFLTVGLVTSSSIAATIDSDLQQKIRSLGPEDRVSVLIMLSDKADIGPGIGRDKARHRESVIRKLREKADLTQGSIIAYLEAQGATDIRSLWIINGISALLPARIVRDLESFPGIQEIILNKEIKVPVIPFGTTGGSVTPEWNLTAIHAPELWSRGHTGQGIVIATMDTGVDPNHPDLAASYRGGANSWFDTHGQHATPFDASGHGTEVMGVLLGGSSGGTAIGVAPGATWIAVKLFDDLGSTTYTDIHTGFQWLLDPDGNPLTNDAPDVINNSWGLSNSGACILDFQADIQALQSAGIYVVFSAGNFGPTPSTSVSPANYPGNLSVGSVSQSMVIDSYSGRGPSQCDNSVYPVVVGPAGVRTAYLTSGGTNTHSYATLLGTSAAAPHVSGTAALLLSAMPALTNAEIDAALKNTAADLGTAGPDNSYGYGFINAYAAFTSLAHRSISGTVRTSGGVVVPGVSMVLSGASTTSTATDASGNYLFTNLIDGSYTVTPSLSTQTFSPLSSSVTISALGQPSTNFTLNTYTVAGTVRTPGSAPIAGVTLTLSGTADGIGAVSHAVMTDAQGQFAFNDVMNGSYTLTPSMAAAQSYTPVNRPVVVNNGNITSQDFTITAYTISGAVRNTGGTAVPGVSLVLSGASTTATVSDASGNYVFANLVNGNYTVTPGLSGQTFTPVSANVVIAAADVPLQNFAVNPRTIIAIQGANGTITPSGSVSVIFGTNQPFFIAANTGYHVADVVVDSVSLGPLSNYTFNNVTANHTISVSFNGNQYTVLTSAGSGGTISPTSALVSHGSATAFTITPNTGYSIGSVNGCGGSLVGSTFTTGAIIGPCTVSATFTLNQYPVSTSAGSGGSISPASALVSHGSTTAFTITPNTGYSIGAVSGCGGSLASNTYTTGTITVPCTVSATFTLNQYTVSTSAGSGGTINPTSALISHGSSTAFIITPNTGYSIGAVTGCGGSLASNTFTTGTITGPCTVTASFTLNQYTVSTSAGTGGMISPVSALVSHGSATTFTITPNTGYSIGAVNGCGGSLTSNTYTTGAITGPCTVTASFTLNQYTVSTSAGTGGMISPVSALVSHGATTTFTVTPNTGYSIGTVSGCAGSLASNTFTTGTITGPCTVSATFTLNQYNVSTSAGSGGAITPASRLVSYGSSTTFTVTPNTGYSIGAVGGCGGSLASNIYTTGTITGPCTVTASFTLNQYTVSTSAGSGGSISPASALVSYGSTTAFTITPNTGYSIGAVSGCGGSLTSNTFTTGAITGPCTVSATFTLNQYTVSTSAGSGGTITPASRLVSHGSSTTFTITPNTGYTIGAVSGCGGSLASNIYTTGTITGPCTVTASFTLNQYTVSTSAGSGGTISPASALVSHGATTTFTVTPNTGYSIGAVTGCGGSLASNTYTTGAITGPCTVTASFTLNQYTVSTSGGAGGMISPVSALVSHGSTTAFTITPNTGYSIGAVSGCGGSLASNTYTTGAITGPCTVTASFTLNQYTVSTSAGSGGSISPASALVSHGSSTAFTIKPNTGYSIGAVTGCGGSLASNTYTTGAITGPCTVTASFTLNQYTVSTSGGAGGMISPVSALVSHGSTTTFTVTPNTGYSIGAVSGCGGSLTSNTYTTGTITGPCTVTASFTLNQYTVSTSAGSGGTINPTSTLVSHGSSTSFTITPNTGYTIGAVSGCGGSLVGSTFTTGTITGPCTVTASFTLNQYTVSTSAGSGGTINPTSALVSHGSSTAFTITPNTGYSISAVSGCGGSLVGSTFTTGTITGPCTVTASFTLNQYTVSTSAGSGGSISPASALVSYGSTTAFTITPNTGYSISIVNGCGGTLVGSTFTTGTITGPCTVSATFTLNQYTVSTSAGSGGAVTPASRLVSHGSSTTFTVTPNTGYSVGAVTGCGGSLVGSSFTTGTITGPCTVSATFTLNQYTVSTSPGSGGTISPTSALVSHGSSTAFTITPNTGYSIGAVSGCGGSLASNIYTTGAITGPCTVTASFTLNQYTVSTSAGSGGTISPTSALVSYGSLTAFTITPNTGYTIGAVSGCGGSLASNTYTTAAITGPCTVTASFTLNQYTVSTSPGSGGTISPTSALVSYGSLTAFTITPNTGYTIGAVSGCGGSLASNTYTTGAITGPCTVTASFTLNQYTVSTSAGSGGAITPASKLVSHGSSTTFTVTPNTGYSIGAVSGCGGSLASNTYTTGTITGPCTVSATFTLNQYTVSTSAGSGGTISPTSALVSYGSTTTFTVTPNTGYTASAGGTCGGSLTGSIFTTGPITGPCTVAVTFTANPVNGACGTSNGQTLTSAPTSSLCSAGNQTLVSGNGPWTWSCTGLNGGTTASCSANIQTYTITPSVGAGGSISPASALVSHGSSTTFTITPNVGYTASVGGTCGGSLVGTTYTTNPITGSCTMLVTFTLNQYAISTSAGTGGTISPASALVSHGSTTAFTITPNTGYSIGAVSGCGGSLTSNTYTTGTITGPCTVSATFTLNQYTVSTSPGSGGTISPTSALVSHGSSTAFTITPNTGYSVGAVTGCGGSLASNTYTTGAITGPCTVTASFTLNQYTVSTSAGAGGMISPVSALVSHGATTTFTVTPNTGYSIGTVNGCGGSLVGSTFTTGTITGPCTVTASFPLANAAPSTPTLNSPPSMSEVTTISPVLSVNPSSDPNGDPISYTFTVYADSGLTTLLRSMTTQTTAWAVTPALSDNTLYYWRALASDGVLNSPWMATANFFVNTVNDPPTTPAISSPVNNAHVATLTPILSVMNAADVDIYDTITYDFDVALDGGFMNMVGGVSGAAAGNGGTTSWTASPALSENTPYFWRVRARDNHGATSNWVSASFFVNTTNSAPSAPTVNAPANASEVVTFTPLLTVNNAVDPDRDTLHYVFEIDTVIMFNGPNKQASGLLAEGANTTSWTPSALSENTTYYWRTKANDGLTDGPWTATASFFVNTVNEAPTAPTLNNPSNNGQVTVLQPTLQVNAATDPDNDALTYEFQVYSNSGLTSLVTSTTGAGTGWVVNIVLTDNTWYWWRARARDVHGLAGNWMTASSFFVNNNGYNDPPTITITRPGASEPVFYGSTYTIQWTAADPDSVAIIALGYDSTGSGCSGTPIATGITEHDGPDTYNWNITNLSQGTYYIYATITDGTSTVCAYGAGPLVKSDSSGDVNGDGQVDAVDALYVLRIVAGLVQPTATDLIRADCAPLVNGRPQPDSRIDIGDVAVILRKAVGLATW
jgi:large repetitive protein